MIKTTMLFSGQGAQYVGMAKQHLLNAQNNEKIKKMYELASDVFKCDILNLSVNGPKNELDRTVNCQVATFVASLANIEAVKEKNPEIIKNCIQTAGYSVGEYAALVFAKSLTFENALYLLKIRSNIMQTASDALPSGLMTVFTNSNTDLKLAQKAAEEWCLKKLNLSEPVLCTIANYIAPGIKVMGGNKEALDFIELNYKEFGITRVKRLQLSGAFHTPLMSINENNQLKDLLQKIDIQKPQIPVYSNVSGKYYESTNQIVRLLSEQYYKPCKWEQIMSCIYGNYTSNEPFDTYESGPGKQLGTFLRLINLKAFLNYKSLDSFK